MPILLDKYINQEMAPLGFTARFLTTQDSPILQELLNHCQDFFLECEGELGTVKEVLTCLPAQKTPADKLSLGIFRNQELVGFFDIVLGYPSISFATIGYFLMHPAWRRHGYGQALFESLARALRIAHVTEIQCVVQKENPEALKFWERIGFFIVREITQKMNNKIATSFVLNYKSPS